MNDPSNALLRSLRRGPLLVGDLPEAACFPYQGLPLLAVSPSLNIQQKLGHLYEDALAVLFEASPDYDLIARNLQLRRDAQTTLGELDFLIRDLGNGDLIHLELATKFYLAVSSGGQLLLPGPDARDNYARKLERLRLHQLVLVDRHRETLPAEFRSESMVVRQLVYGCLFDHVDAVQPATPDFINPDCRRGHWLSIGDCARHFPRDSSFEVIPKHLWPVPLELLSVIRLESWSPDMPVERCVMLRVNNGPAPYFVTPRGYPGQ